MGEDLDIIAAHAAAGARARQKFFAESGGLVRAAAMVLARCLADGHKILICGNGGSAADCQHMAAEFVNRFLLERPALAAIALATDTSILTSIGNDRAFALVFARQVEALGAPGDMLVAISTSGSSANVLAAVDAAREKKMVVIGLTGEGGGAMADRCDYLLAVPDRRTPIIQETHLAIEHLLCRLADYYLFEDPSLLSDTCKEDE